MEMERKAERTAKFNKNKKARNRQTSKKYIKDKRERDYGSEDTGVSRDTDRPKQGE